MGNDLNSRRVFGEKRETIRYKIHNFSTKNKKKTGKTGEKTLKNTKKQEKTGKKNWKTGEKTLKNRKKQKITRNTETSFGRVYGKC